LAILLLSNAFPGKASLFRQTLPDNSNYFAINIYSHSEVEIQFDFPAG